MSVWTNWDPLEEVIVGDCYEPGSLDWYIEPKLQSDFNKILDETKQDLGNLAKLLTTLGVQVHRPKVLQYRHSIELSSFSVECPAGPIVPRDQYLVYGDTVYQTYTSMNDRYFDSLGYYDIFRKMFDQGHNWISQPPPDLRNLPKAQRQGSLVYSHLYKNQLLWHGATMFKCGDRLITNTTGPGSRLGLEWMRRNLSDDTVLPNFDTAMNNWGHIDHGFFMIDDNTVICVDEKFVPKYLRDKIIHQIHQYLPNDLPATYTAPVSVLLDESKGYDQVVKFDSNVLVVDPKNIIFDRHMPDLFEFLATMNVKCHVATLRHRHFWASGIHCSTLDIRRRGEKRKIINEI
jgi:N-dimethylarginine dimethylaminohydrolase